MVLNLSPGGGRVVNARIPTDGATGGGVSRLPYGGDGLADFDPCDGVRPADPKQKLRTLLRQVALGPRPSALGLRSLFSALGPLFSALGPRASAVLRLGGRV